MLINTPTAAQEWIEFTHKPGEKFFDFIKVDDKGEAELTARSIDDGQTQNSSVDRDLDNAEES